MKFSDYKNEDALELLADLLEPVAYVLADPEVKRLYIEGIKIRLIQYILKEHGKETIQILARLDGVEVKDYDANIVKMTRGLLEIVNDEELIGFFTSQEQMADLIPSGSVTENTKEKEK